MNFGPKQLALLACLCAIFAQTVGVHLHGGSEATHGSVQSALTHHPVDHLTSSAEPHLAPQAQGLDQPLADSAQESKTLALPPVPAAHSIVLLSARPLPVPAPPSLPAAKDRPGDRPPLRAPPHA
jgi:hypothetical protein